MSSLFCKLNIRAGEQLSPGADHDNFFLEASWHHWLCIAFKTKWIWNQVSSSLILLLPHLLTASEVSWFLFLTAALQGHTSWPSHGGMNGLESNSEVRWWPLMSTWATVQTSSLENKGLNTALTSHPPGPSSDKVVYCLSLFPPQGFWINKSMNPRQRYLLYQNKLTTFSIELKEYWWERKSGMPDSASRENN